MESIFYPEATTAHNIAQDILYPATTRGIPGAADARASTVRTWLEQAQRTDGHGPSDPPLMRLWLTADLLDLKNSTPEQANELKKTMAGNYFAFPEYAEMLDSTNPMLSREIKPIVELTQVADFFARNIHRTKESATSVIQYANAALKSLLSDEAKMRDMEGPLAARLHWIDSLHLKKFGAVVASALGRADAAELHRNANDALALRLREPNAADPFHPLRLEREARTVAEFVAANQNLQHWKIAENVDQAEPDLHAILNDAIRMRMLDPFVDAHLAGLPHLRVSEAQAVIANVLDRIDADERTGTAASERAAAGLEDRNFNPWLDVEAVVEFVAINHRLDPHVIFQNLAAAGKELRAIFADRAHLESIEEHINQQMPQSASLAIANFHEVVAISLDRGDALSRMAAAESARETNARQLETASPPETEPLGRYQIDAENGPDAATILQPPNEQVDGADRTAADSPEHLLAIQQAHQINCFVLPNARKLDEAVIEAFNAAPSDVKSILSNPVRMGELAAVLSEQSDGVDPIDLRRIQALLASNATGTPVPAQPGRQEAPSPEPSDSRETEQTPPPHPIANGFRPAEAPSPGRPVPASVTDILERITHKTKGDGSVEYSLDGRPAFVDHGDQILMARAADRDEQAIVAALLVAKEKYNGAFELTGDIEFKRRAIEVMIKYKIDAALKSPEQDAMRRDIAKSIQAEPAPTSSAARPVKPVDLQRLAPEGDSTPNVDKPSAPPVSPTPNDPPAAPVNRLAGKVLRYGSAPYEHKPRQKMSYFIELENSDGQTRTTWGVDLERVATIQQLNVGDKVVLQNLGRTPVEVKQDVVDKDGKVIGSETIVSHRNTWEIDFVERAAKLQEHEIPQAAPAPDTPSVSLVDAAAWWSGQHKIIQNLAIDYSEMQADLGRLGPRPAAGQAYWFEHGRPSAAPPNAAEILAQNSSVGTKAEPTERYEVSPGDTSPVIQCATLAEAMANVDRLGLVAFSAIGIDTPAITIRKHCDNWERDDGHPLSLPNEQNQSDRAELMPVLHALRTLPDDKSIVSLLLFKADNKDYLQGFVHIGEQKQQVIAHMVRNDAERAGHSVQLSAMTPTPDGPRWQAIGYGTAINHSDDGRPLHYDEVRFTIGESTLIARVNNQLGHALRQEIGFEKPRRERSKDESAVTPAAAGPEKTMAGSDKGAPDARPVRKQHRQRNASPKG